MFSNMSYLCEISWHKVPAVVGEKFREVNLSHYAMSPKQIKPVLVDQYLVLNGDLSSSIELYNFAILSFRTWLSVWL